MQSPSFVRPSVCFHSVFGTNLPLTLNWCLIVSSRYCNIISVLHCCVSDVAKFITNRISVGGNAIASVRLSVLSVRPFVPTLSSEPTYC